MPRGEISLETLNAYVDGELGPVEASAVARRAATDPQVAATISTLQQLRAGVAGLAPEAVILPRVAAPVRAPVRAGRLAVAALVVVATLATAAHFARPDPRAEPELVAQLVASHDDWTQASLAPRPVSGGADVVALMAATGLTLVADARTPAGVRQSVFLGARGCRLSLFELPGAGAAGGARLKLDGIDDLLTAQWQSGPVRYVLMARRMDEVRFATIASSMRAATAADPVDRGDLIAALEGARQRCLS